MKKDTKAPRLTLAGNPSAPKNRGITLEPVKVESECVTIHESFRGYIVLTGHARIAADGEWADPIVTLECPAEWVTSRVCEFLESLVKQHGFTDERPRSFGLSVVRGGLVS